MLQESRSLVASHSLLRTLSLIFLPLSLFALSPSLSPSLSFTKALSQALREREREARVRERERASITGGLGRGPVTTGIAWPYVGWNNPGSHGGPADGTIVPYRRQETPHLRLLPTAAVCRVDSDECRAVDTLLKS